MVNVPLLGLGWMFIELLFASTSPSLHGTLTVIPAEVLKQPVAVFVTRHL